jgi:hypothetical protein
MVDGITFRARRLQTWLWYSGCCGVVERVVVDGGCLQVSSGWLAFFGLCFLSRQQRSAYASSEVSFEAV